EQDLAGRGLFDAARAHIEEGVLLDLADGGAVSALHVVGVDLELGLGVDLRVVGEQQVAVGLLGVGLLRVRVNDDAPVEDAVGALVEDAVIKLAAAAVRAGMLDEHVVVHVLGAAPDEEAVDEALAAFPREHRMNVIANQAAAQKYGVRTHVGASRLLGAQGG